MTDNKKIERDIQALKESIQLDYLDIERGVADPEMINAHIQICRKYLYELIFSRESK